MRDSELNAFLASVRRTRFVDYLDPLGETAQTALERRLSWARVSQHDPAYREEARFLIGNSDALRDVLRRELAEDDWVEDASAGAEWGGGGGARMFERNPRLTENDRVTEIFNTDDLRRDNSQEGATPRASVSPSTATTRMMRPVRHTPPLPRTASPPPLKKVTPRAHARVESDDRNQEWDDSEVPTGIISPEELAALSREKRGNSAADTVPPSVARPKLVRTPASLGARVPLPSTVSTVVVQAPKEPVAAGAILDIRASERPKPSRVPLLLLSAAVFAMVLMVLGGLVFTLPTLVALVNETAWIGDEGEVAGNEEDDGGAEDPQVERAALVEGDGPEAGADAVEEEGDVGEGAPGAADGEEVPGESVSEEATAPAVPVPVAPAPVVPAPKPVAAPAPKPVAAPAPKPVAVAPKPKPKPKPKPEPSGVFDLKGLWIGAGDGRSFKLTIIDQARETFGGTAELQLDDGSWTNLRIAGSVAQDGSIEFSGEGSSFAGTVNGARASGTFTLSGSPAATWSVIR